MCIGRGLHDYGVDSLSFSFISSSPSPAVLQPPAARTSLHARHSVIRSAHGHFFFNTWLLKGTTLPESILPPTARAGRVFIAWMQGISLHRDLYLIGWNCAYDCCNFIDASKKDIEFLLIINILVLTVLLRCLVTNITDILINTLILMCKEIPFIKRSRSYRKLKIDFLLLIIVILVQRMLVW